MYIIGTLLESNDLKAIMFKEVLLGLFVLDY